VQNKVQIEPGIHKLLMNYQTSVFLAGMLLFVGSDTFAVGRIV